MLIGLGVFVLGMWHKVCANRSLDVSFSQWLLLQAEDGQDIDRPLGRLKDFQLGRVVTVGTKSVWRKAGIEMPDTTLDSAFKNLCRSATRRWIEIYLPLAFTLLWTLVGYLAIRALLEKAF